MTKLFKQLLATLLFLTAFSYGGFGSALKKQKFLNPEDAFKITAVQKGDVIETEIRLADKIHIYKNELKFRIVKPKTVVLNPKLPPAHTSRW